MPIMYSENELEMMDAISAEDLYGVKRLVKSVEINKVYFRPDGKPYTFLDLAVDFCMYSGAQSQCTLIIQVISDNGGLSYRSLKRASMKQEQEQQQELKPKLNTSRVKTNGIASLPRRTSMFLGNVIKSRKRKTRKTRKSRKNN
jgi:hypothetical protein